MTTHKCMHLVTGSYFRLCNKEGGHIIRSAIAENPMLHTHFATVCDIDAELLGLEFSHCGDPDLCWRTGIHCWIIVDLFCSFDLDLDPVTFIYKLDPYTFRRYTGNANMNFLHQGF